MPVVVEPRLSVMMLPRQAEGLVDAVGVVLLFEVAPRVEFGGPDDVVVAVGQRNRRAQVIAVVEVNLDRGLLLLRFLLQPLVHAVQVLLGGWPLFAQHRERGCGQPLFQRLRRRFIQALLHRGG